MPGEFLPPAERFGLVQEIDRWVVAEAVKLAKERRVEVNLSGKSIGDAGLIEQIETQLRSEGADPANLIFEITETAAAENLEAARDFAWRLRALGCGFALDDFGTGYGTFAYLKHLPVTFIKIDIEFVRYLAIDPSDQKIVKSIIAVAQNFGVETIAEGVEHQTTLDLLRELGRRLRAGLLDRRADAGRIRHRPQLGRPRTKPGLGKTGSQWLDPEGPGLRRSLSARLSAATPVMRHHTFRRPGSGARKPRRPGP